MGLLIAHWNIAENNVWFVRLADSGSGISVELYLSQANAQAQTNMQASGSSGYGSSQEVALTNEIGATNPVSLFRDDYDWHLMVSGAASDSTKIYKVKEFVDIDEISHAIYRNSSLITARANSEINAHTHAAIIRSVALGKHLPLNEVGDIARLTSTRRAVDDYGQIVEHTITGTPDSLESEFEIRKYLELKR